MNGWSKHHKFAFRPCLLGRAERSSPKAQWRAEGAGLEGERAYRAMLAVAAMRVLIGHCPQSRVPFFTYDGHRWGNASTSHVSGELFNWMTGVSMVHVPYRGDAPECDRMARWRNVLIQGVQPHASG
jgi:hypothetical protein